MTRQHKPNFDLCNVVVLKNWNVIKFLAPSYQAPELRKIHLGGYAINHPKLGTQQIITSNIVFVNKRFITTESGTCYYLSNIDPKYRRWLRKNRPNWNWREPITALPTLEANDEVS